MGIAECEFCHGNHEIKRPTDEMVGVHEESICAACHSQDSRGYAAARQIRSVIDSLRLLIEEVQELADRSEDLNSRFMKGTSNRSDAGDAELGAEDARNCLSPEVVVRCQSHSN